MGVWGAQAAPKAEGECKVGEISQEREKQALIKGKNPWCLCVEGTEQAEPIGKKLFS